MRVLLGDRGHREAGVLEGRADVGLCVEVLAVALGEGVTVTGPRDLDPGVARTGAGSTTLLMTKSLTAGLTRDDGVGDREVHHRVGVEVEHEPAGGPKPVGHRSHRRMQLSGVR